MAPKNAVKGQSKVTLEIFEYTIFILGTDSIEQKYLDTDALKRDQTTRGEQIGISNPTSALKQGNKLQIQRLLFNADTLLNILV